MAVWKISKRFDFIYGHRVWNQVLDRPDLSIQCECKCRHLHGHQGSVTVFLSGIFLENDMVTDFHNLSWLKEILDLYIDHKMLLDFRDPLVSKLIPRDELDGHLESFEGPGGSKFFKYKKKENTEEEQALKEMIDGIILMPFVPTSEQLSKWFYDLVEDKMGKEFQIEVIFSETPKTTASFM